MFDAAFPTPHSDKQTTRRAGPFSAAAAAVLAGSMVVAGLTGSAHGADDVLYDGRDGATCDYFNSGAKLHWKNRGGDWVDAKGVPQGSAPFASRSLEGTGARSPTSLDVTALVNQARAKGMKRVRILLRSNNPDPKGNVALFHSREAKEAALRPGLTLKQGGEIFEARLIADSELNCTTLRSLGDRDPMRIGQGNSVVMEYQLPEAMSNGPVSAATLQLVTTDRRFRRVELAVFRMVVAEAEQEVPFQSGLAARYPGDAGLEKHPAVVFVSRFDSSFNWKAQWSQIGNGEFAVTSADRELGFAPLQGSALRVNLAKGKKTGLNMNYFFRDHAGGEPEEIYFRYYIRLGNDWNPTVTGGKLPGIAGTYDRAGWGGRGADGTNGWSMRGSFFKVPVPPNPINGATPIGTYAYHADMPSRYGEDWQWPNGGLSLLEKNRWYCIEQYVKLNDPQKNDGIIRAWVDGRLALERTDVRYRSVASLKIEQIWMNVYHGGTEVSPYDQHLFIDNVVVAREYIGPIPNASAAANGPRAPRTGQPPGRPL